MLLWIRAVTVSVLVAGATAAAAGSASAQTFDDLLNRFRGECVAQYPQLKGPALKERARECITGKFIARARSMTRQPVASRSELKLGETTPWLCAPNRGPAEAKGIIYFVRGYRTTIDSFVPVPYFIKTLSERGWDTLAANIPQSALSLVATDTLGAGAAFMRRRVAELKAQGYKRVVLAGHSWGAWAALLAAHTPDFGGDALLVSAPAPFGSRISVITNQPNALFSMNLSEFPWALASVRTPSVVILPDEAVFEPDAAKRGAMAEKHFAEAKVASLVITKPQGFTGHLAAWLPVFDYAFGRCIEAFIEDPATRPCEPSPLSNDDFRSIVGLDQLARAGKTGITSAEPLVGKKFVVYSLAASSVTHHYEYRSATERRHTASDLVKSERITFRDDLHCVGNQCSKLIAWGEGELLEFDPKGGKLAAWWVEQG